MLRWRDRRWRAAALQRKSCDGVDQYRNAEQDQNHAEPRAPASRRRLTHANNYLIVESRRPCESVSTRPTVQHIGHPRSATRAATPAPKDSQGCAVWWTMAQARSAAATAPRIRCTPRKALPNMPTPRKYFMCSLVRCPLCRAGIRAPMTADERAHELLSWRRHVRE